MKSLFRGIVALALLSLNEAAIGQAGNCRPGTSTANIESENVRARVMNQGDFFWEPAASLARFQWPKNSSPGKHLVFAAAHWFGGKDLATGDLIVSAQTYRGAMRTFWPGPAVAGILPDSSECAFWNRHFEIDRATVLMYMATTNTSGVPYNVGIIPTKVLKWPGRGNPFLKAEALAAGYSHISAFDQELAPFIDKDGDGVYNPTMGDYPDLKGKLAAVWWVMNDVGNTKNFNSNITPSPGVNLEFQTMAYSYPMQDNQHYLANSIFIDLKIINRGSRTLDTCYTSFWSDIDLGYANDDLVQCDVMRNLGICYNGDNMDEGTSGYGTNPPAIAFKAIDGPMAYPADGIDNDRDGIVDEPGEKSLFSGFRAYWTTGSSESSPTPQAAPQFYNFMTGKWNDGYPTTYGGQGLNPVSSTSPATKFFYPGSSDPIGYGMGGTPQNPMVQPEWSEITAGNIKGDRRICMSAGPFQLVPGSSVHYTIGNLVAFGGTNLENIAQLGLISDSLDQYRPTLIPTERKENIGETTLSIFPNPGSEVVLFECQSTIKKLIIRDLQGRLVFQSMPERTLVSTNLEMLPSGIYSVQVLTTKGVQVKKLVKL